MKNFGLFSLLLLFLIFGVWYAGFTLSILWGWFVSPLLNLPELSIAQAVGFALTVGFLTRDLKDDSDKKGNEKIAEMAALCFIKPTVFLGFGYIYQLFL